MSNPIHAAKAGRAKDAKNPVGTCPLKRDDIQLAPLRYGLVENPNEVPPFKRPFATQSKPLGVRLLRDGWLYILAPKDDQWLMNEYLIEEGQITKRLWSDTKVTVDTRTSSMGEATLIFKKDKSIYAAYSELQWTASKCSQVIDSDKDRQRFMQHVSLSNLNPLTGSQDLLTAQQAKQWVAEFAHPPSHNDTNTPAPYCWEHKPLYQPAHHSLLAKDVLPEYQGDHFYLVVNDDIGVLRDLASYQHTVSGWLEEWQSDEERHQKYIEGCYIETQITLSPKKIDQLAVALGSQEFANALNPDQKQAVINWFECLTTEQEKQHTVMYEDMYIYPNSRMTFRDDQLKEALGERLWKQYFELIKEIEEHYRRQVQGVSAWDFLNATPGARGIKELIELDKMEAFLKVEREKLAEWHQLLDKISQDRTALFIRFYFAAWYFDSTRIEQFQELLAAEYSSIQDICWSDTASQQVADQLHDMPWIAYSGVFTLPADDYDKLTENLLKTLIQVQKLYESQPNIEHFNAIGRDLNNVVNPSLPGKINLVRVLQSNDTLNSLAQLNQASYAPANTLGLVESTNELFSKMANHEPFDDLHNVLRHLNHSAWVTLFKAYQTTGVSVAFSTAEELKQFQTLKNQIAQLRQANTSLKNRIRQEIAQLRQSGQLRKNRQAGTEGLRWTSENVKNWRLEHKSNQAKLDKLEPKLAASIQPFGEQPSKAGFYIKGLNQTQLAEAKALSVDLNRVKANAFKTNGWDALSLMVVCFSVWNAVKTYRDITDINKDVELMDLWRDFSAVLGAAFGFAQGINAGIGVAALKVVKRDLSKLMYGARLGRWTAILGGGAYLWGGLSLLIKSGLSVNNLHKAIAEGDSKLMIKSSIELGTEGALTALNGVGLVRSMQVVWAALQADKAMRAAIWASNAGRLLSLGVRLNLIGIAISALQLGVKVLYHRYSLSDYMRWFKQSRWGIEPHAISLQQSHLQLATLSAKPQMTIEDSPHGKKVLITFPNITINELDQAGVEIAVYWSTQTLIRDTPRHHWTLNTHWEEWTTVLQQQWVHISQPNDPVKIGLPIFVSEIDTSNNDTLNRTSHGMAIELHYYPTPDVDRKAVVRFEAMNFSSVKEVAEFQWGEAQPEHRQLLTTADIILGVI